MRRFFGKIDDNFAFVEGDEFLHLKNVLRMNVGDDVVVFDGNDFDYHGKIIEIKKNSSKIEILDKCVCPALPRKNITLFQAFTKREKLELIVQKAVELGIKEFVPFSSKYCVAKDAVNKKERLEKIVISACKQCERSDLMKIGDSLPFGDMLKFASKYDVVIFANERDGEIFDFTSLKNYQNIAIIVGPEGGFSEEEKNRIITNGAESISLGKRILRSETASIVLCGIVGVLSDN